MCKTQNIPLNNQIEKPLCKLKIFKLILKAFKNLKIINKILEYLLWFFFLIGKDINGKTDGIEVIRTPIGCPEQLAIVLTFQCRLFLKSINKL